MAKQWMSVEGTAAYGRRDLRAGYLAAARLLPEDDAPLRVLVKLWPAGSPQALAALDAVIAENPDAVLARRHKARLLAGREPESALGVLLEAQARAPEAPDVLAEVAAALVAVGRHDEAAARYAALLEARANSTARDGDDPPLDVRAVSNALDALLHPGDPAHPIEAATRVRGARALCAANPADPRFGNNAGLWFRDEAKDYEASLEFYLIALEVAPDDVDLLNDTAFLFVQHLRDDKAEALPLLEKARRLVEDEGRPATRGYWDALEHLCRYYFEVGRYRDVVTCADLRLAPEAKLNGRRYPSAAAATWRQRALDRLAR